MKTDLTKIRHYSMTKKGIIQEIFSKAQFADDPYLYKITFRDFDNLKILSLPDFLIESENFQTIPVNRIKKIMKNNKILFEKIKK